MAVPASASAATSGPALRIMPMGDSITEGYQSSTGNGYRQQLWNDLTGEGHFLDLVGNSRDGSMTDPDNEGHSGWRIDQIAGIADATLAKYKPNVITLMIGTNDLNQPYQPTTAAGRLSSLVDQITSDDPTATVFVASLILTTSPTENQYWASYNATIPGMVSSKQSAGKHVVYVDMSHALGTGDLYDSLHPNDGGYAKMGDVWAAAVHAAAAGIAAPQSIGAPVQGHTGAVNSGVGGKCLDAYAAGTANSTKVDIWSCNGTGAQQFTAYSDGSLRVDGKCLDDNAFGTANGSVITLWDCNGGVNQVWQAYNGGYLNPYSGRCLDDPALSTTDGTAVSLWDCNGGANQRWTTLQRD